MQQEIDVLRYVFNKMDIITIRRYLKKIKNAQSLTRNPFYNEKFKPS